MSDRLKRLLCRIFGHARPSDIWYTVPYQERCCRCGVIHNPYADRANYRHD